MIDLIRLANLEYNVRKKISVNLTHLVRFAAISQSGGLGLPKSELTGLIGCDSEALNYLLSIQKMLDCGFAEGESTAIHGRVVCGGCSATVFRLPCIKCGHSTWIKKVVSLTKHKQSPTQEPEETYSPKICRIPSDGRRTRPPRDY